MYIFEQLKVNMVTKCNVIFCQTCLKFNFGLNCFVKDTDKTRLLYMLFPLNSFREIFSHFFIMLGNLGKKLRDLCLLVEIATHSSNCVTVAALDNRLEKWSNFNKSLNVQFS